MRVALVHDYIREYGGAERVLKVLTEMYPNAPIYTAFSVKDSTAEKQFRGSVIHECWLAPILKIGKIYSPLRFLIPVIWRSFDLSNYDLVITSSSWYITRGFRTVPKNGSMKGHAKIVCYCHTPPRWLYGYAQSVGFSKHWFVKIYALLVGHFLRIYDFKVSQAVGHWIVNSKNVQDRVWKFYRKRSVVIYPPVDVETIIKAAKRTKPEIQKGGYFLIVSRLVGAKGIEEAISAFSKLGGGLKLKIVGEKAGFKIFDSRVNNNYKNIEFLGRVDDEMLWQLYAKARGFIALAKDEDFGMTVVEAQAAGCPVIAYRGGGFKETVIDGETGIFVDAIDEETIKNALKRFIKIKWNKKMLIENARRFSKERFVRELRQYIDKIQSTY